MLASALVLLAACTGDAANDDTSAAGGSSTPYDPDLGAVAAPELGASEVEAALDEIVPRLRDMNAGAVIAAYESAMGASSGGCPVVTTFEDTTYWGDETCTTGGGATFSGGADLYSYRNEYLDTANYRWTGDDLHAEATIDTGGGTWSGAGIAWDRYGEPQGSGQFPIWYSRIAGTFSDDGSGGQGTFLADNLTPHFDLEFQYDALDEAREALIDGGVTGLSGAAESVWFYEVFAKEDDDCAAEPDGQMLVRDGTGYWYELVFDGDCDGCGSVMWDGEDLGDACVDISPVHGWEDAPW